MDRLVLFFPLFLQALAMLVDEGLFHRRRGLPRWERLGHPMDTLTAALCYGWMVLARPSQPGALAVLVGLACFSCLFITKDEFVHARLCSAGEQWLHSLLFVLHPLVFLSAGLLWWRGEQPWLLRGQLAMTLAFGGYQVVYWSVLRREPARGGDGL